MSCVYGNAADGFFKKTSVYNVKNPSKIERKISDFAGNISNRFDYNKDKFFESHGLAFLAFATGAAAAEVAGVSMSQAAVFYVPIALDAAVHTKDFAVPRIKTAIKNMLTENPYAGNEIRSDNP